MRPVSYSPNTPSAGFEQFTYSVPLGPHGEVDVLDLQVPSVIPAHTEPAAIGQLTVPNNAAMDIYSLEWAGLASETGRPVPSDLIVTKGINQASHSLFNSARIGSRLATVVIKVNDPKTGVPYITYTLSDALFSLFKSDDSLPSITERLGFSPLKLNTDITIGGVTTTSCWDFVRNVSC
jgi:type VI protein secretion system component Hcp